MIFYLVKNRIRPAFFSMKWLKYWAKRVVHLSALINIFYRRKIISIWGATIGQLSIIGKLNIDGKLSRLYIGESSFIGSNVHFASHEEIIIHNNVTINDGVRILTATHDVCSKYWNTITGKIIINNNVWIATGAIILPNITIGEGAVVGAGAVVTKDVLPFTVVAGNPAKYVGDRIRDLDYSPIDFCSVYEAWLGSRKK